jgi:1-deoxy-D-xylulose-5-phosphate synthase
MLGIPDRLVEHGSLRELHHECGYDAAGIANAVRELMKNEVKVGLTIGG